MTPTPMTPTPMISRRHLLGGIAAATAAGACSTLGVRSAAAGTPTGSGRLVSIFLRGGMDHLSAVFPLDDPDLARERPTIAVDGGLDLDGRFALHPAMPRLHELHREGTFVPVVATGNPAGDRSHFVAQDLAALGDVVHSGDARGWLGRHLLATASEADPPLRAVTVGANVDRSLAGYPALGLPSIQQFGLGPTADASDLDSVIRAAHTGDGTAERIGRQALAATDAVVGLPAASDEDEDVRALADVATLLDEGREAGLGTEVVTVDLGGWDTHAQMGTTDEGEMRTLLGHLDSVLGGFVDDLDRRGIDDVTIVVATEFGRRVRENGSGGTDHGWGSAMFVLGPGLRRGAVAGDWPGLSADVLGERGDVPVTTDFRDVLAEVAGRSLGVDAAVAFVDHDVQPVGLFGPD